MLQGGIIFMLCSIFLLNDTLHLNYLDIWILKIPKVAARTAGFAWCSMNMVEILKFQTDINLDFFAC